MSHVFQARLFGCLNIGPFPSSIPGVEATCQLAGQMRNKRSWQLPALLMDRLWTSLILDRYWHRAGLEEFLACGLCSLIECNTGNLQFPVNRRFYFQPRINECSESVTCPTQEAWGDSMARVGPVLLSFGIFLLSLRERRASPLLSPCTALTVFGQLCIHTHCGRPLPSSQGCLVLRKTLAASSSPRDWKLETVSLQLPTGRISH